MNICERFKCCTCEGLIDCRIGMSNRDVQPFRFACPLCGEIIELTIDKGMKLKGAEKQKFKGPFTGEYPFVDLHIDFPVSFDKYVMGHTPFMKAIERIGHDNLGFHNHRLNILNQLYPLVNDLGRIIRLYSKNTDLFSRICESKFGEKVKTQKPQDVNAALYCVIAKVFFPFAMPQDNAEAVDQYMEVLEKLLQADKAKFDGFMKEIIESGFLKNIQKDCLEIYPRILEAELPLRSALFLDFDDNYKDELISLRVSVDEFQNYKDLYKDISEIMSRELVLVAGINNLLNRGDYNDFKDIGKNTPKDLHKYADVPYGLKLSFLDDSWYEIKDGVADNKLRNSIAHYKVEYDEVTQVITYYPRKEGIKQDKEERMYFLDFMRKILISYREMHRLHQLIKCLHNYYYFMYEEHA